MTLSQPVLGPAHFQTSAMTWPFGGDWTITFAVRTDEFTRNTTTATISVR